MGIIVDKYGKNEVVDVKRLGVMIIALKFVVEHNTFNVISAYAPQVGLEGLGHTFRRKDFLRKISK